MTLALNFDLDLGLGLDDDLNLLQGFLATGNFFLLCV